MAKRIRRVRKSFTSSRLRLGNLSIQAVASSAGTKKTSSSASATNLKSTRRDRRRGTIQAVTTTRSRTALANATSNSVLRTTRPIVRVPLANTIASLSVPLRNRLPLSRFQFQKALLLQPSTQKFSDDVLDMSETIVKNNDFVPAERNGISSYVPEILQITDFLPVWDNNAKQKRYLYDFSAAGRLIDVQYNTLILRRETLNDLIKNMAESKRTNSANRGIIGENQRKINLQINRFEQTINKELAKTEKTIKYYQQFIDSNNLIKRLLDIKNLPQSKFDKRFLSLEDFFMRRMQYSKEQFRIFSDTKIIQQLLSDFREISENYSINLLGLSDPDRVNDDSPVFLDKTYTLNDGFAFTIEQIRSTSTAINASERAFFNTFLNSLPNTVDDRIKLLVTLLSKEYRVSRGLGIPSNKKKLNDIYNSGDTGSPFDNIIGVVGSDIFENPLGPESLLSSTILSLNEQTSVLPFESKYVDSEKSKRTYVPGASFFVDGLLEVTNNNFNTKPLSDFADLFSKKVTTATDLISNLFNLEKADAISATVMNDKFLAAFRNSNDGIVNVSKINKDQAAISAVFKLANTDNVLKSKLFQFCLLAGLAANNSTDIKPIFKQLSKELGTINRLDEIQLVNGKTVSLFGGLRILRPYIERLANDIENRVLALTTPTPRLGLGLTLRANPQFTRLRTLTSQKTSSVSSYTRLNITAITEHQVTLNFSRYSIKQILLSNIDSRSSSSTNFIREFVNLANEFSQAAAYNGEQKYLLGDSTGRTRYNFLSTSTQLLILFEILSSYVSKYSFSTFTRSPSVFNMLVTVDAAKNTFIDNIIDDLIGSSAKPTHSSKRATAKTAHKQVSRNAYSNVATTTTAIKPVSIIGSLLRPTRVTIIRSGAGSVTNGQSNLLGGILSRTRNSSEKTLLQKNLSSPFLGTKTLQRIGLTKFTPLLFTKSSVTLRHAMVAIRNRIKTEDVIIENIIHILNAVAVQVKEARTRMLNIYNQKTLTSFLSENTLEDLEIVKNPTQIQAAAFALTSFMDRTRNFGKIGQSNYTWYMDSEIVQADSRVALYSMLAQNDFLLQNQADKRIKVISVGIPAGFSRQLADRVQQSAINSNTFKTKQFDVVSVKVYKRDQRFDDIAFKPQTFLFDLSLFQDEDKIGLTNPRENESFDRIINRISAMDYQSGIGHGRKITYQDIVRNDKYDFLTNNEKRELIKNLTASTLFELYIRLLTGLRIEEQSFLVRDFDPGTTLDAEFLNIVYSYIENTLGTKLPNKPLQQLLNDPKVDDSAKDILRLFVFGDVVFEPQRLRNQIVSPKLFDRVYHLSINSEKFEIDEDLTKETESGRLALEQTFVQERLFRDGDKLYFRPKDRNELQFEDYFVSIENII